MNTEEKPFFLTGSEVALVMKMALLPIKLQSQISPEVLAEAMTKLIEKGMLQPEDLPTDKDFEEYEKIAEKFGLPAATNIMN